GRHRGGWELALGGLGAPVAGPPRCFLCRLIPPRPTFARDMTEVEARVMRAHVAYWRGLARVGVAKLFGPVADPRGSWGVGIIDAKDEAELEELKQNDPAIRSGLGFSYEAYGMPRVIFGT